MERVLQYLDDLDDAFAMAGLVAERVRRFALAMLFWLTLIAVAAAGAWLAILHPPLALASSSLMFVLLLYRSVTSPIASLS